MIPLGIRLNNPGNLRPIPGVNWVGQTGEQSGFCMFSSAVMGLRALAIDLYNANLRNNTVRAMVTHYAPPSENNTEAYIQHMCAFTGVGPDDIIHLSNATFATLYIRGVIVQEQGLQNASEKLEWYPESVIRTAMEEAGKWTASA